MFTDLLMLAAEYPYISCGLHLKQPGTELNPLPHPSRPPNQGELKPGQELRAIVPRIQSQTPGYPLVNIQENMEKSPFLIGKSS